MNYEKRFLKGLENTVRMNSSYVSTSFPSFSVAADVADSLGFLSFNDDMVGDTGRTMGRWNNKTKIVNGGLIGGPLVLFAPNGQTVILSAMSNFMAASMEYTTQTGGSMFFGVMGSATSIPVDYQVDFILYYSDHGINKVCICRLLYMLEMTNSLV